MIMIPNSCFSVLHVDYDEDKVQNDTYVNMTLEGTGLNEIWNGTWMDMVLEFGSTELAKEGFYDRDRFNLSDYDKLTVNLTMFVTNNLPVDDD